VGSIHCDRSRDFFRPRSRSRRTASIISSWSSRKSQMPCSSGSSKMPCCSNLPIGETDLRLRSSRPRFSPPLFSKPYPAPVSTLGHSAVRPGGAVPAEHARCLTSAGLGEPIPRARTGKAASLLAAIEDIAGVLLPGTTGGAIRANARTATKVERAEGGRPQVGGLLLQPALDVGKGFGFRSGFGCHAVRITPLIHTCQGKI